MLLEHRARVRLALELERHDDLKACYDYVLTRLRPTNAGA